MDFDSCCTEKQQTRAKPFINNVKRIIQKLGSYDNFGERLEDELNILNKNNNKILVLKFP